MTTEHLQRVYRLERIQACINMALKDSEAEGITRDDSLGLTNALLDALDAVKAYRRENKLHLPGRDS